MLKSKILDKGRLTILKIQNQGRLATLKGKGRSRFIVLIAGLAILLCLVLILAFTLFSDKSAQQAMMPPPQVAVMILKTENVPYYVELPGRASAYAASEVRPQVTGIIQERLF